MHGVNLDLLHSGPHHADGRSRDPHAHHRVEHLTTLRIARRARWQAALSRLLSPARRSGAGMATRTAP